MLTITQDGKEIPVCEEFQKLFQQIVKGKKLPIEILDGQPFVGDVTDIDEVICHICHFLLHTDETVGAYIEGYKYLFGSEEVLFDIENEGDNVLVVQVIP